MHSEGKTLQQLNSALRAVCCSIQVASLQEQLNYLHFVFVLQCTSLIRIALHHLISSTSVCDCKIELVLISSFVLFFCSVYFISLVVCTGLHVAQAHKQQHNNVNVSFRQKYMAA